MVSHRLVVACVAVLLFLAAYSEPSFSQSRPALQSGNIPSPKSVLGFTPGDDRTMAELSDDEKHEISHRGRAARLLAAHLGLPPAVTPRGGAA